MRNKQSNDSAVRIHGVSPRLRHPDPPLPDMPSLQVGEWHRVRNLPALVLWILGDWVGVQVPGTELHVMGLLVRWNGYVWRVVSYDEDSVTLEAWGRTILTSPKLEHYR